MLDDHRRAVAGEEGEEMRCLRSTKASLEENDQEQSLWREGRSWRLKPEDFFLPLFSDQIPNFRLYAKPWRKDGACS